MGNFCGIIIIKIDVSVDCYIYCISGFEAPVNGLEVVHKEFTAYHLI